MRIPRPPLILLALFAFLAGTLSASVIVLKDGSRVTADARGESIGQTLQDMKPEGGRTGTSGAGS